MLKKLYSCLIAASFALSMGAAFAQGGMGGMGGQGERPDFSAAAETLGVTEDELLTALGGPPPDFAAAAKTLGVTEEQLREVVPAPPEGGEGGPPQ